MNKPKDCVTTYRGVTIDDMSREEAIATLKDIATAHLRYLRDDASETMRLVPNTKHPERYTYERIYRSNYDPIVWTP